MARSDLLIRLFRAGAQGDLHNFQRAAESIVAEEKEKQHNVLATRLSEAMHINGTHSRAGRFLEHGIDGCLQEILPERHLHELVLEPLTAEIIQWFVDEQLRSEVLQSYGLNPRNRIMLAGPPGNGKTVLAEAIASALSVPLLKVRYDGVIGKFLGETSSRLRKVFDYARQTRCVLFFDEFDAIGKERGDTHETGEIKRVVSGLLMQIDDLPSYATVIVASNHPGLLDNAVWRRFQVRVYLPAPTNDQCQHFLARYAEQSGVQFGLSPRTIAQKLTGASYGEVEEFCLDVIRRATIMGARENAGHITETLLRQWAIREKTQRLATRG